MLKKIVLSSLVYSVLLVTNSYAETFSLPSASSLSSGSSSNSTPSSSSSSSSNSTPSSSSAGEGGGSLEITNSELRVENTIIGAEITGEGDVIIGMDIDGGEKTKIDNSDIIVENTIIGSEIDSDKGDVVVGMRVR